MKSLRFYAPALVHVFTDPVSSLFPARSQMFHAGGWGYPVVTALNAAVNVVQRQVRAKPVFDAIVKHKVRTASVVLSM